MRRRDVITATGLTLATASSGCLGFTIQSKDDVQKRENRIEELEGTVEAKRATVTAQQATIDSQQSELRARQDEINRLNQEISQKESRIATLESDKSSLQQRVSALESDVETLKKQRLSELYAIAHSHFTDGQSWFSSAESSESNGDYGIAEGQYGVAYGRYLSANDAFSRTEKLATDMGASTNVVDPIESAVSATNNYATAAINYANEMLFRNQGDTSTADGYESDADSAYAKAQNTTIISPKEFDSRLGI